MSKIKEFERDVLFLSVVSEMIKKYGCISFEANRRWQEDGIVAEIHMPEDRFRAIVKERETEKDARNNSKYKTEEFFVLHGVKVLCIY